MSDVIDSFLTENSIPQNARAILCVAQSMPSCMLGHDVTFFGLSASPKALKSSTAESWSSLLTKLEDFAEDDDGQYDVVYIHADHAIEGLVRVINACVKIAHPNTLYIFPGGAPERRGIATPQPSEAWWLGDIWTLGSTFRKFGVAACTLPLGPLGLLLARGLRRIPLSFAKAEAATLQQLADTAPVFDSFFHHFSIETTIGWLAVIFPDAPRKDPIVRIVIDAHERVKTSVEQILEELPWVRPQPAFIANLSDREMSMDILQKTDRLMHGIRLSTVENATIIGRDLVLAKEQTADIGCLLGKNYRDDVLRSTILQIAKENVVNGDIATRIFQDNERFYISKEYLDDFTFISEPILHGTPDEYLNYGMWLLYSVPSVHFFQRSPGRFKKYFACLQHGWQKRMLISLGLTEEDILPQDNAAVYKASSLTTMCQSYRSLALSEIDRAAFDEVGFLACKDGVSSPSKIFVSRLSRTKAGAYRGLSNEAELAARLSAVGFAIVEPELYDQQTQARIFRSASVVIGLGGAGMFNVAFCKEGTKIVDIESSMGFVDSHANLFASRGTEYGIIIGKIDRDDDAEHHKRWSVDIEKTMRLINDFV